ncbi:4-hydroxy-3-methylbut-2-enyl diphosphate reductase [Bifidobacterium adolescentis]|uniref:4-hydroxy-3-methylbut-2-enyl diphosphate reductase n=2 Tax=Bifidobacterium TaxID=1678 RepID=A0A087D4Q6_BIFRU|nr:MULTISPECIES: 4-hydroxy-3-methylbut-2-enyl diphosphate reductase [Bifidobacterium]KAB5919019.1 4-hydroxy-3-methylbut-2-enyl diphosphate reductase [Bifidobacterium adolescentis]KFI90506.1 4-hydroxy-3-methylbut-2-enyl diphosphate reductase [Bifidobacterium ruminantium]MBU9011415.1 4-hydroxy-3-methylbut-2-enyl diphosphate reductase [Bifidobacterium adolescentis]MBU9079775.1 4-hydroxy-3-methylbut-2-enyl diphosphate reductase [Bifidobacterium adolescentis]MDB1494514.1 4-hydroxy-3-methylbut-2-eny
MGKRIVLADPRGFCAGVDRAILTVRTILKSADTPRADGLPPVYVRRQIVHNKHVVEDLAAQGAVFVQELAEIPDAAAEAGIPIVFSAHGVSPAVKAEAAARGMHVVDATCPLVSKVHREVLRFVKEGYEIIYIGHKGHDEAVGVVEESPEHVHLIEHASDVDSLDFQPDTKLVLLTQTTLSVDETAGTITALKARFPWLEMPPNSDICYATSNRQAAVKLVAQQSDCVVIVGSANSSNSVRLMEVAQEGLGERGKAYRVDDASELDPAWFEGLESVGISSGASVPDELVSGVIDALQNLGFTGMKSVETIKENMHFVLPAELRRKPLR